MYESLKALERKKKKRKKDFKGLIEMTRTFWKGKATGNFFNGTK